MPVRSPRSCTLPSYKQAPFQQVLAESRLRSDSPGVSANTCTSLDAQDRPFSKKGLSLRGYNRAGKNMLKQRAIFFLVAALTLVPTCFHPGYAQEAAPQSPAPNGHEVPVMNGEAGSCSLELTVTDDAKPVYAAKIKVHIAYGLFGARRLDLEAYTNADGKVRFTGLPARVRKPPLYFDVSKGELIGRVAYDPEVECEAKHDAALKKPGGPDGKQP